MAEQFIAIDVETANQMRDSICQIGLAIFRDGAEPELWQTLVDPQCNFRIINVSVHGINASQVRGAPTFEQVYPRLVDMLTGQIVVSHSAFDQTSIDKACAKYDLPEIECTWLDTVRVARRTWLRFTDHDYGLANIAQSLDIDLGHHHNAIDDARAAGEILLKAMETTGLTPKKWCRRASIKIWTKRGPNPIALPGDDEYEPRKPVNSKPSLDGNADGPLAGEVVVFTGTLTMSRPEAAQLAAQAGCTVRNGITKKTTLVVVGEQDLDLLKGHTKSSKHRKAEALIAAGQPIRIIGEDAFRRLVGA